MSKPYEIILAPFPLTNLTSQKIRPALQLSKLQGQDIVFCAISTKKHSPFDIKLTPTKINGLKQSSYVRTDKIATIEQRLVLARLDDLESQNKKLVKTKLKKILDCSITNGI